MKCLIGIIWIVLVASTTLAQQKSITDSASIIDSDVFLLKNGYTLNRTKITKAEALEVLKTDSVAYAIYKKGKENVDIGTGLLVVGGVINVAVVFSGLSSLTTVASVPPNINSNNSSSDDKNSNGALIVAGLLSSVGGGIALLVSGNKQKRKSFRIYNQHRSKQLSLKLSRRL